MGRQVAVRQKSNNHLWILTYDDDMQQDMLCVLANHADDDDSPMTWDHAERITEMIIESGATQ